MKEILRAASTSASRSPIPIRRSRSGCSAASRVLLASATYSGMWRLMVWMAASMR